jgi:hypothetical protein
MKSDNVGAYLAILLAVVFVVVGIWLNVLNDPDPEALPPCDYGITTNCEP